MTGFGSETPYAVGVEEEVFLVDADTRRLAPMATEVLERMGVPESAAHYEAYAAELEFRSEPEEGATEAVATLGRLRATAGEAGATVLVAGLHPAAEFGDAELVPQERYVRARRDMGALLERTPESALHVHVGMPSMEAAIAAYNGLRGWLPVLIGLAGASPFWFGADSDLDSARWAMVRSYPGRGIARELAGPADYERLLADSALGGGPDDYTLLWWDVRPQPRLGTVEVREMDAQPRLADAATLAALVQGLGRAEAEDPSPPPPREAIEWSCFRAARDGTRAEVVLGERLVPLSEAARAATARAAQATPQNAGALTGVERILAEGNAAARMRVAHRDGGMDAVLELLARESAEPL